MGVHYVLVYNIQCPLHNEVLKMKDKILHMRLLGLTYSQISKELNCSKSVVCYYCSVGQKEKNKERLRKHRSKCHPFKIKLYGFFCTKRKNKPKKLMSNDDKKVLRSKIKFFLGEYMQKFTEQDIIDKFGKNTICYLTGEPIDINKPRSYHFDHKVPTSKGGTNTLDNLGICTKKANQSKTDMTHDEYLELCKAVLIHHGYNITKSVPEKGVEPLQSSL